MTRFDIIKKYASEYLMEKVAAEEIEKKPRRRGPSKVFGALGGIIGGSALGAHLMSPTRQLAMRYGGLPLALGGLTGGITGGILGYKHPYLGLGAFLGGLAAEPAGWFMTGIRGPHLTPEQADLIRSALSAAGIGIGGYLGLKRQQRFNKLYGQENI